MPERERAKPSEPAPVRPAEPDPSDCCGGGCARCVWDVHDDAVARYEVALAAWKLRQVADG